MAHRRSTCHSCGKPLGANNVYCYECRTSGSVDTSDVSEDHTAWNDVWGAQWKLTLGVSDDLVFAQHDYDEVKEYL